MNPINMMVITQMVLFILSLRVHNTWLLLNFKDPIIKLVLRRTLKRFMREEIQLVIWTTVMKGPVLSSTGIQTATEQL